LEILDSGFRRNDAKREFLTFYEFVKIETGIRDLSRSQIRWTCKKVRSDFLRGYQNKELKNGKTHGRRFNEA
jgi:hypothetical protein